MATVQLSDIYNPLTFAQAAQEKQQELNRFINSGVMVRSPMVDAQASTGGNIGELPFGAPLGTDEPNYSTDNPATLSTPKKVTSKKMKWRLASQNQSWSTMDLSRELALEDPAGWITTRIGQYWATVNEKRVIQSCLGILADNKANDSGDMVVNIATDAAGAVGAAETISGNAVIDALGTMGDHDGAIGVIAVHSKVRDSLRKQNLIEFVRNSEGVIMFEQYLGKRLLVDDSLPAVAGTNRITYTSILFGAGAFVSGEGRIMTPSEMLRKPDAGNGGGEEIIYSRRADIIHPMGFSFESASVAGQSATHAELATAGNWNRVFARKQANICFLQTNA